MRLRQISTTHSTPSVNALQLGREAAMSQFAEGDMNGSDIPNASFFVRLRQISTTHSTPSVNALQPRHRAEKWQFAEGGIQELLVVERNQPATNSKIGQKKAKNAKL